MPDFPVAFAPGYFERPTHASQTVTANASDNVKGTYTELITSTPRDWDALLIALNVNSATIGELFDVAVGPGGSEQVIVPNLLFAGLDRHATYFLAPVAVPAGSRIAARCQATSAGGGTTTGQINVSGFSGSLWSTPPAGRIIDIGLDTATSKGTVLDAGTSAGTLGAWTQLVTSTAADIVALAFQFGNNRNATPADLSLSVSNVLQIGVGASTAETVVIDRLGYTVSDTGVFGPLPAVWFPCSIPAGSRIAARIAMNTTDATDRVLELATYGLVI